MFSDSAESGIPPQGKSVAPSRPLGYRPSTAGTGDDQPEHGPVVVVATTERHRYPCHGEDPGRYRLTAATDDLDTRHRNPEPLGRHSASGLRIGKGLVQAQAQPDGIGSAVQSSV